MTRPNVCGYDCTTGEITDREMTEEEYAELLATGWTPEAPEPTDE
jgi:hypothetical protein